MSDKKKKLQIRNADDIYAALKSRNHNIRNAMLKSIRLNPKEPLSYCKNESCDLIDTLITMSRDASDLNTKMIFAYSVLVYSDERVTEFAKEIFATSDNSNITLNAAAHLAGLPAEKRAEMLSDILMKSEDYTRRRAAANLLADCKDLPDDISLRIYLTSDHKTPLIDFNSSTIDTWIAELRGFTPEKTKKVVSEIGSEAFSCLLLHFDKLTDHLKNWTLIKSAELKAEGISDKLDEILISDSSEDIIKTALTCCCSLREPGLEKLAEKFFTHPSGEVRAKAYAAGPENSGWQKIAEEETDSEAKLALISRMLKSGSHDSITTIYGMLSDSDWRVRSRAARALAEIPEISIELLKEAMCSENEFVKIAAAQAMSTIGFNASN